MIIRPPAIEADSQLQNRLCRRGLRASLARQIQLGRYSVLGLKVLSLRRLGIRQMV
jgi:hypothetical protein